MRIGVYARGLSERVGGVKEYIRCMCQALIEELKNKDELFIIHNNPQKLFQLRKKNIHEILLKGSNKFLIDFLKAPPSINKLNLDVCWFPKNVIPFGIKAKKMVTVHDLAYFMPKYNAYRVLDTLYM
ncbi:hypothetical protein J7J95_03690, partial [bacterium]|nr:hypothetical protein [bacterium]